MKKNILLPFVFLISLSAFAFDLNFDLSLDMFKDCKIIFDEGVSYSQVTRIEKMENRSNFVRENMMIGAYFSAQTTGLPLVDFELDIGAYYPFYQAFNGMKQNPKNMLNYSLDAFFGIQKSFKQLKYIYINTALGMHYMYQLTDEYHMHYVGIGAELGCEWPLTQNWTLINRNFVSYDNANLGSNKNVQPFDASYHYSIDLGVRYTKRVQNAFPYFKSKAKAPKEKKAKKAKKNEPAAEGTSETGSDVKA